MSGLSGVTAIAGGDLHSLALLSGGAVDAGSNGEGEVGDGTTKGRYSPLPVSGLSGVTAIAAGAYHSMALLSSGSVMAWGWDSEWQLGNVNAEERSLVPVPVTGLSGVTAISGGQSFQSCRRRAARQIPAGHRRRALLRAARWRDGCHDHRAGIQRRHQREVWDAKCDELHGEIR